MARALETGSSREPYWRLVVLVARSKVQPAALLPYEAC